METQLYQSGFNHKTTLCKEMLDTITQMVRKSTFSDLEIYLEIRKLVYPSEILQVENKVYNVGVFDKEQLEKRASKRVADIARLLPRNFRPTSLLDIGCADGSITLSVMKHYGIPSEKGYGVDVEAINVTENAVVGFNFHQIDRLPTTRTYLHFLPDNSVDLVIALMSLHHVADQDSIAKEISRVLKPGGYLAIREHDCNDDNFSIVLDVMHGLYALVWSNPLQDIHFLETYVSHYKSRSDWRLFLSKYSLQFCIVNFPITTTSNYTIAQPASRSDSSNNWRNKNLTITPDPNYGNSYVNSSYNYKPTWDNNDPSKNNQRYYYEVFTKECKNRSGPPPRKVVKLNNNY